MAERIPGTPGGVPVRAWYRPKPDLGQAAHLPAGTPGVRVEFLAPAGTALLSDFQARHCLLNSVHLAYALAEARDFESRCAATGDPVALARCDREMRRSWPRVFDLDRLARGPGWWAPCEQVQAVLWRVTVDQVVRATTSPPVVRGGTTRYPWCGGIRRCQTPGRSSITLDWTGGAVDCGGGRAERVRGTGRWHGAAGRVSLPAPVAGRLPPGATTWCACCRQLVPAAARRDRGQPGRCRVGWAGRASGPTRWLATASVGVRAGAVRPPVVVRFRSPIVARVGAG